MQKEDKSQQIKDSQINPLQGDEKTATLIENTTEQKSHLLKRLELRPNLFKRLSLPSNLIQFKSNKVQTPPLEWASGVDPMSSLSRSQDRKEYDNQTQLKMDGKKRAA